MSIEVFVARQPIFNSKEEVFAYKLLYRNNQVNAFPEIDEDQATAEVIINSFLNIGIDYLSKGKPCFINFTEELLKLKLPAYFWPREIVVEILETVVIMSTHDVPSYFQSYYEMIQNLSNEEPSLDRITELIERDISLSYKLLKLINSPAYRPKQKINSIRHAMVLLGLKSGSMYWR